MTGSPSVVHPTAVAYAVEGTVLQAGDLGPARTPGGASPPGCMVTVWHVSRGSVSGVDVSGLTLVAVSHRDAGSDQRVFFLDERASLEQVRPLVDLLQGRLGVSWAGFGSTADRDVGVYQVPVDLDSGVTVPGRLRLTVRSGTGDLWLEIPELDLVWRSARCPAARAGFRVEG